MGSSREKFPLLQARQSGLFLSPFRYPSFSKGFRTYRILCLQFFPAHCLRDVAISKWRCTESGEWGAAQGRAGCPRRLARRGQRDGPKAGRREGRFVS